MVIGYDAFDAVEMRVGTVVAAEPFPAARKPAYKLTIDFGEPIGRRRSSAQITSLYSVGELLGTRIVAVVNFAPKNIAGFSSEVLVLGVSDRQGRIVLLRPDHPVDDGARVF